MKNNRGILGRAVISGTVSGLATAGVASFAGKYENGSYAAPLNATSHIIWGEEAAYHDRPSLKYTLTGFLLNHASTIFWASFYEKLSGSHGARQRMRRFPFTISPEPVSLVKPVCRGAAVAVAAYIIDYYLIPKRFTPGFEKRVSGKSLTAIFAALAVGLAARDVIDAGVEFHKRR
ncbi:hypothetical protein C8R21_10969 [Nitrosospira multiformis]|uniref:Uncharacterized protein n=1 Tax=Nitrosospira multiformis TaxID=1231 RepID=A0A2T5ICG0_9PROT|nr:hypothetical protein [Nitrosospira multiformis]PTQ81518.1 hypothetical protein C8R21_10969 [Nitrosospira multiformis]